MKANERVVMMFGFEKKDQDNITIKELKAFKKLAKPRTHDDRDGEARQARGTNQDSACRRRQGKVVQHACAINAKECEHGN